MNRSKSANPGKSAASAAPSLIGVLALSAGAAFAHLKPGSLKLTPEGPYRPGDTVAVSWGVDVVHDAVDIGFSSNGGKSWTMVKADFAARSNGNYVYQWVAPAGATEAGKIRLCQKQGRACTDADSVSRPSGPAPYVMISPVFKIAEPTALAPDARARAESPLLRRTGPGGVELTLDLEAASAITMAAYDLQGREKEILLSRTLPAGSHRLSLFSEALRAHPEWILRLRTGKNGG